MPWVDHLRTATIVLVVNMHACVTYSHVGDWYVLSEHEPSLPAKVPFIVWQAHLQAFFMGLLFFVSGFFAHRALTRRGPAAFARERLFRLGAPTLLYMLAIHPFILLGLNPWRAEFGPAGEFYLHYLVSGRVWRSSGPLWFTLALLIFSLVLAAWRAVRPAPAASGLGPSAGAVSGPAATPTGRRLLLFGLALGLASFLVRLVQPIGTNILNLQLCFFPQYVAAFAAGVFAARRDWLLPLAASAPARRAGWCALIGGPIALLALMFGGVGGGVESFAGGWHWQALGYAVWEQLAGVGLSLGLLAWFSARLNRETPLLRWMSDRSFAVYVLHAPVLVALMMVFRALPQNAYALIVLLTVTGLLVSYAAGDIARRIPGLRAIV